MFNVCPSCGQYQVDKKIEPKGTYALAHCGHCGYAHSFRYLPLFFLTGPSGAGKSIVGLQLQQTFTEGVVIDKDIFWMDVFNDPELGYLDQYNDFVLRACKNITQQGKPVLLVGTSLPQHLTSSLEKRYFSSLHFLALVASPAALRKRLEARPAWRGFDEKAIQDHLSFNQWFWDRGNPDIELHDTSHESPEQTGEFVRNWMVKLL